MFCGLGEYILKVTFQRILSIMPGITFVGHKALEDGQAYRLGVRLVILKSAG